MEEIKKKRILHILASGGYSGAENEVIAVIRNLSNKYDFAYVSPSGPIQEILRKEGILHLEISGPSSKEIARIVKGWQPDLIQAHDYRTSVASSLARTKVPIISHLHSNPPWLKTINPNSLAYLLASFGISCIIGVSSSIIDEYLFRSFIKNKYLTLPNFTDSQNVLAKAVENIYDHSYDLAFLGRLEEPKDPLRFITIVNEVAKELPEVKSVMIGSGTLEDECSNLIKQLHLEKNITMVGFKDNPYAILNQAKLLVMPSKWEGFGLAAVEAMVLGKPVFATKVGGLPSIVHHKCGFLCEDNEEFRVKIVNVLKDADLYTTLAQGAQIKARQFTNVKDYLQKLSMIYELYL